MDRLWSRIKRAWLQYWREDEFDNSKKHLSQSDKRSIWYGAFIMCMVTVSLCCFVIAVSNLRVSLQNEKDVEEILNTIGAYMASATEEEYDDIAKSIRRDLILGEYGQNVEEASKYIPNTSKDCITCIGSYPAQAYLLCTNTGELYSLDLFENDEESGDGNSGTSMSFGYDEISETSIQITKNAGQREGSAVVRHERGIVSVHRMKTIFCDACISKMLNTVQSKLVEEFVIFDADKKLFYPVSEGGVKIGDYDLQMEHSKYGNYDIGIRYTEN